MATSTLDQFRIDGKVAIITGAGKGIGAAMAAAFAEAGADLVLTARTAEDLEQVAEVVRSFGRRAVVVPGDVNDFDLLAKVVDTAIAAFGRIDIVVNNAGGSLPIPFRKLTVDKLERSFRFNVFAAFELCRLALPHLLQNEGAAILNISSMAGLHAERGMLLHSLTKNALNQLTRLLAAEFSPKVRVNALLPGAVETDSLRWYLSIQPPEVRDTMIERTPMRRNGIPEDIAAAALYLVSPASSWVTGKMLEVDGNAPGSVVPHTHPDL